MQVFLFFLSNRNRTDTLRTFHKVVGCCMERGRLPVAAGQYANMRHAHDRGMYTFPAGDDPAPVDPKLSDARVHRVLVAGRLVDRSIHAHGVQQ